MASEEGPRRRYLIDHLEHLLPELLVLLLPHHLVVPQLVPVAVEAAHELGAVEQGSVQMGEVVRPIQVEERQDRDLVLPPHHTQGEIRMQSNGANIYSSSWAVTESVQVLQWARGGSSAHKISESPRGSTRTSCRTWSPPAL